MEKISIDGFVKRNLDQVDFIYDTVEEFCGQCPKCERCIGGELLHTIGELALYIEGILADQEEFVQKNNFICEYREAIKSGEDMPDWIDEQIDDVERDREELRESLIHKKELVARAIDVNNENAGFFLNHTYCSTIDKQAQKIRRKAS